MMNKEAFEAIIDNAQKSKTGRMNAVVPVDMIDADPLYQRIEGHNEAKLKKLEKEWDYNLMDSLIIVPHPETNNFFVVDGLGRLMVARRLNIRKLDCVIIAGPEDIDKRRVFEAKYFLRQADCTDKIKPVDKHNARVLSGDPAAVTVENLMKTYQVEIKKTKGRRAMRQLGSYDAAYEIAKTVNGKEMLEKVMLTLDKAGYMEQTNGLSARIMNPLVNIFRAYADMPGVTENFLGKFMRQTSPSLLIAKAAAKYPERGWRVSLTLYLQDYITETLAAPVMFDSKGKKVIYLKTA